MPKTKSIHVMDGFTPHWKMQRAMVDLVDLQPWWGYLLGSLDIIEDPTCKTAWVNGVQLGWNPAFIDKLSLSQVRTVLAHEVSHCADGHPWRRDGREFGLWNDACDYSINPTLLDAFFEPIEGWLYDVQYYGKPPEWIYSRLEEVREEKKKQQSGQPSAGDGAGKPQKGSAPSNGTKPPPKGKDAAGQAGDPTQADAADGVGTPSGQGTHDNPMGEVRDAPAAAATNGVTQEAWQQSVFEATAAARHMGNMPGHADWMIDKIRHPKADWRQMLMKFFDENADDDYSWDFPDVDFIQMGMYLPDFKSERMGKVVIGWDTSASTSKEQKAFGDHVGSILNNVKPEKVIAIYADYIVQSTEEFDPEEEEVVFHPKGHGGTSFIPVFDWVEENDLRPALLIYFTDLEGSFPEVAPNYPVMWVSVNENLTAPFGETTYILDGGFV